MTQRQRGEGAIARPRSTTHAARGESRGGVLVRHAVGATHATPAPGVDEHSPAIGIKSHLSPVASRSTEYLRKLQIRINKSRDPSICHLDG